MKWIFSLLVFSCFLSCQQAPKKTSEKTKKPISSKASDLEEESLSLEEEEALSQLEEEKDLEKELDLEEFKEEDSKEDPKLAQNQKDKLLDESEEGLLEELEGLPLDDVGEEKMASAPKEDPEPTAPPTGNKVLFKDIKFLSSYKGGTIVLETDKSADYEVRHNEGNKQFVVEVKNAKVPKKLKRPYVLKDFARTPFSAIHAYQKKGSKTAHVVIQMKDDQTPKVKRQGSKIFIHPERVLDVTPMVADSKKEAPPTPSNQVIAQNPLTMDFEKKPLGARTYEEFLETGSRRFYGKPISVEVTDLDIKEVIKFIASESNTNIFVADGVGGNVSLKIKDAPWDQILITLLEMKDLGYVRRGNILLIAPLKELERKEKERKDYLQAKISQVPLVAEVIYLSYASPDEVQGKLQPILTAQRGKIVSDKRTGALIVTDTKKQIEKIKDLVRVFDVPPRQVMIEGKIVEASESFSRDFGINWNLDGSGTDDISLDSTSSPLGENAAGVGTFTLSTGVFDLVGSLSATLRLSETDQLIKVLSAPRIIAMNGETATIQQTSEVVTFSSTSDEGIVSHTAETKPITLSMQVTPQITHEGSVIMDIDVKREFPGATVKSGDASATPTFSRSAKTQVLVRNGQTAVIGGIYQHDQSKSGTKLPFLSKIPILGWLFKSTSDEGAKNELLIFLTPHIVSKKTSKQ